MINRWIGIDLDGTLAHYTGWKGPDHIGEPIPLMMAKVKQWIAEGNKVKIFTARAATPSQIPPVKAWLVKHGLGDIEVTCVKDMGMTALYDDRCYRVETNTGRVLDW